MKENRSLGWPAMANSQPDLLALLAQGRLCGEEPCVLLRHVLQVPLGRVGHKRLGEVRVC